MGDYQKDLAIHKLEKAFEILEILTSKERAVYAPECRNELLEIMELIRKAKEDVANV